MKIEWKYDKQEKMHMCYYDEELKYIGFVREVVRLVGDEYKIVYVSEIAEEKRSDLGFYYIKTHTYPDYCDTLEEAQDACDNMHREIIDGK